MGPVANPDRLTGLDTSFLHIERESGHMHLGACSIFEGPPPCYEDLVAAISARIHLVPRFRQRLAFVPLEQGRPVWVDDPHFQVRYHVRHTALPRPGAKEELERLAGRIFSQAIDRSRPLWELWLVEGLVHGCPDEGKKRFALVSKTHPSLVDGVSGVDLVTVLLDPEPAPESQPDPDDGWLPRPVPTPAQLLADALIERATVPAEIARSARALLRTPRRMLTGAAAELASLRPGYERASGPPASPFNVPIGPHRRFTWLDADLASFKQIKDGLGGTVNDVVLAAVAGALGSYLRQHGRNTEHLELRALVPVSVQVEAGLGALGNRVAARWAPLPVGMRDPVERMDAVRSAMDGLRGPGQAVAARTLTELTGYAPPTIMAQAARLQARSHRFNLAVTNIPGPQVPEYLLGRELKAMYPMLPLPGNTAIGIGAISSSGRIGFGITADYDALPDIEGLGEELRCAVDELVDATYASGHRTERPALRLISSPRT